MKHYCPQISWHDRDAILSCSFQPRTDNIYRVVTGGTRPELRIWEIKFDDNVSPTAMREQPDARFVCTIRGHTEPINVVRFSPDGRYIASGENKCQLFVWEQVHSDAPDIFAKADDDGMVNEENWQRLRLFRCQTDDVSDLCWTSDSVRVISVSCDKSCVIYNVKTGTKLKTVVDHHLLANGVCVDPLSRYFVTMSNDRTLRLYSLFDNKYKQLKKVLRAKIAPSALGRDGDDPMDVKLFHDDQLNSFVRRPAWSPDGELIIAPAGCLDMGAQSINCTYVFTRKCMDRPSMVLPCPDQPTIVACFNPILFELFARYDYNEDGQRTQLLNATGSPDGLLLFVTSQDGYCSVVRFAEGELGTVLQDRPEAPPSPLPTPKVAKTPKEKVSKTPTVSDPNTSAAATPQSANANDAAPFTAITPIIKKSPPPTNTIEKLWARKGSTKRKSPQASTSTTSGKNCDVVCLDGAPADDKKESGRSVTPKSQPAAPSPSVTPANAKGKQKTIMQLFASGGSTKSEGAGSSTKKPRRIAFETIQPIQTGAIRACDQPQTETIVDITSPSPTPVVAVLPPASEAPQTSTDPLPPAQPLQSLLINTNSRGADSDHSTSVSLNVSPASVSSVHSPAPCKETSFQKPARRIHISQIQTIQSPR